MASLARLSIEVDRDWAALVAYKLVLEWIAERGEAEPWETSVEELAETARIALDRYPTDVDS